MVTIFLAILFLFQTPAAPAAVNVKPAIGKPAIDREIGRLEKNLRRNILPFWLEKSLDRVNGGYTINFGPRGEAKGPGVKMIVTQARQVWLFARLARAGYCGAECLEAAEHGYQFLREKMWDARYGGFYWQVDATGEQKQKPNKHLYGQSFALYAISEYALASGRRDVRDFAIEFFDLLEAKAHDRQYGGYREYFLPDWSPGDREASSYMSGEPGGKLMNTHLHLLEALTTFYRATMLPLGRERLLELINIQSNTVVRKSIGACTDKYQRDWTPRLDGENARVSYGHDLENIWLLIDACEAAGVSYRPFLDLFRTLFDYSMKYGYDAKDGGFFDSGRFNQPADRLVKVWWAEAEAIVSALYMYRLTGERRYFEVYQKTYDLIENRFVDWENGEWHANLQPDGTVSGDKAQPWKAGYHNGRAMVECIQLLKLLR
jgi:mannobiose 2-epimerase